MTGSYKYDSSPSQVKCCLPSPNPFCGLFSTWMYKINPSYLGNVPPSVPGQFGVAPSPSAVLKGSLQQSPTCYCHNWKQADQFLSAKTDGEKKTIQTGAFYLFSFCGFCRCDSRLPFIHVTNFSPPSNTKLYCNISRPFHINNALKMKQRDGNSSCFIMTKKKIWANAERCRKKGSF